MKIFPSNPPLKRLLFSGAKAKLYTWDVCLVSISIGTMGFCRPLQTSVSLLMGHRRTILSCPPDANRVPLSENSTVSTHSEWPKRSDSFRWTAKHLAPKTARESWNRVCPDSFPPSLSLAAVASVVLLTDLLATICPTISCSTSVWK